MVDGGPTRIAFGGIGIRKIGDIHRPAKTPEARVGALLNAVPGATVVNREVSRLRLNSDLSPIRSMPNKIWLPEAHRQKALFM